MLDQTGVLFLGHPVVFCFFALFSDYLTLCELEGSGQVWYCLSLLVPLAIIFRSCVRVIFSSDVSSFSAQIYPVILELDFLSVSEDT